MSEVSRLRFSDFQLGSAGQTSWLQILGKAERRIPISAELAFEAARLAQGSGLWAFTGFHRAQPMGTAISDRAVELLTRSYAERLGVPGLTPRAFRHSAVVAWNQQGLSRLEIRERLGLKTDYAFRVYEPLFVLAAASQPV